MTEEWRDVPGYPYHQASNLGRLRTLDKIVPCCHGSTRLAKGRLLDPVVAKKTGYRQTTISRRSVSVHRLVALAWCDGYLEGLWVDHLNGIRTDNRPENLEWVTPSENCSRPYALNRREGTCKGKFSAEHPTAKPVIATCLKTGIERVFASAMDAVREGFDSSAISRCCNGLVSYHKGNKWRFGNGIELHETERQGFVDRRNAA